MALLIDARPHHALTASYTLRARAAAIRASLSRERRHQSMSASERAVATTDAEALELVAGELTRAAEAAMRPSRPVSR